MEENEETLDIHPARQKFADMWTHVIEMRIDLHEMKHAHMSEVERDAFDDELTRIKYSLEEIEECFKTLVNNWDAIIKEHIDFYGEDYV